MSGSESDFSSSSSSSESSLEEEEKSEPPVRYNQSPETLFSETVVPQSEYSQEELYVGDEYSSNS